MSAKPARAIPPPKRRNAWRGILLLIILVLAGAAAWIYWGPGRAPDATPTPSSSADTSSPQASTAATPDPSPSIPDAARQEVWTSDTTSSGEYATNTAAIPSGTDNPTVVDYVVKVETSVPGVTADGAAQAIQATLDDSRGWAGYGKTSFRAVTEASDSTLVITIASPGTTEKLCASADVGKKGNCQSGNQIVLNSDRWLFMTPTYDDLGAYRAYIVNHEVGRFLNQNVAYCPGEGKVAPVMMDQSVDLYGCTANPWPRDAD